MIMAERRMFSKTITNSARFLMMPPSARLLYYDLGMAADDDGVVEAFAVMRLSGALEEDLNLLVAKGYVKILNDELVSYICDWKRNNYIQNDRYHPSIYKKLLEEVLSNACGSHVDTGCIQDVYNMDTQVRVGKDSIDKDSLVKWRGGADGTPHSSAVPTPPPHEKGFFSLDRAASPQADRGSDITEDPVDPDSLDSLVAEGISEGYINERRFRAEGFARRHKRRVASVLREWWARDKDNYRETDRSRSGSVDAWKPSESSFDTDDFFEVALAKSMREMEEMYGQSGGG
jgi:hypothetical protein